jgi:heat shock protein HslJ
MIPALLAPLALAACQTAPLGEPYAREPYPPQGGYYPQQAPQDRPMMLGGTNWRVTAINGRPTPPGDFTMRFEANRLSARLGCNSLGAGYAVAGTTLTAGALLATRMACPDMSFENAGAAVLARPVTLAEQGPRLTLSNSAGSIELLRVR